MKYKKNIKSYKKIKGGTAITNEYIKMYYGLYILANICLKYYIQFRIWCITFLKRKNTDIETDESMTDFLNMYHTNFEDTYKTTIKEYTSDTIIYFNDQSIDKTIFATAILRKYGELFFKHTTHLGQDFKPYINVMYIKSKFKLFEELNIIVNCDDAKIKKKLYELYALYIIALSNDELFEDIKAINNYMYKSLYYNMCQIKETVIRNCIDFYNNMLYQLLFFNLLNIAKDEYFNNRDDIENNKIIIKEKIYEIIRDFDIQAFLKLRRYSIFKIFFEIYDSNINDEIKLFIEKGIDEIIQLSNDSDIALSESFSRPLNFDYAYRSFLILDQFMKTFDILK